MDGRKAVEMRRQSRRNESHEESFSCTAVNRTGKGRCMTARDAAASEERRCIGKIRLGWSNRVILTMMKKAQDAAIRDSKRVGEERRRSCANGGEH